MIELYLFSLFHVHYLHCGRSFFVISYTGDKMLCLYFVHVEEVSGLAVKKNFPHSRALCHWKCIYFCLVHCHPIAHGGGLHERPLSSQNHVLKGCLLEAIVVLFLCNR